MLRSSSDHPLGVSHQINVCKTDELLNKLKSLRIVGIVRFIVDVRAEMFCIMWVSQHYRIIDVRSRRTASVCFGSQYDALRCRLIVLNYDGSSCII